MTSHGRIRHRRSSIWLALLVGLFAFVYRFNALGGSLGGFDNDHFGQLVRVVHVADGELPLRDFADAELRALWPPLTYETSAAGQLLFGRSLRSEALVTIGLLALGAASMFWVAADVAGIVWPAALVALLGVALSPNLYNYPKIVTYAFAVIAMVAYARRPSVARLLLLAVIVVIGTLFRHDHGVFLGLSSIVVIVLSERRTWFRQLAVFTAAVLIGLLPGFVFVQRQVGLVEYLRSCLEVSRQEANRTRTEPVVPSIDLNQPLLERAELPRTAPRIGVVWGENVTPATQEARERVHGLTRRTQGSERHWAYDATDSSPERLAALVRDPLVAGTDGIDRVRFTILRPTEEPRWVRWQRRVPILRWRLAPGVLREANAVPWLYVMAWAIVLGPMVIALVPFWRRAMVSPHMPAAALAGIVTLGLLLLVVFLRNPIPPRLPDVSVPIAVLGAWLLASLPRAAERRTRVVRLAVKAVLAGAVSITIVAVWSSANVAHELSATGFTSGPRDVAKRWGSVWRDLGQLPATIIAEDEEFARALAYLRRCTSERDRLFIGENLPQVYYFADRRFAAGHVALFSNFYSSQSDQRQAIERWQRQSVPIALIQPGERFSDEFGSDYPVLAAYLQLNYRRAGELEVDHGGTRLDVWARAGRASTVDRDTGLPCFR